MESESKCYCQYCSQHIAFDPTNAGRVAVCPSCGLETTLYIPQVRSPFSTRRWFWPVSFSVGALILILAGRLLVRKETWARIWNTVYHDVLPVIVVGFIALITLAVVGFITKAKLWTRLICIAMCAFGALVLINGTYVLGAAILTPSSDGAQWAQGLALGIGWMFGAGQMFAGLVLICLAMILWNVNKLTRDSATLAATPNKT